MKTKFSALIFGLFLMVLTPGCWLTGSDTYDTTKYTAAHQAALDGDDASLAPLLKSNPRLISVPDYDKDTLLHLAVMHDRTNTVSLLLDSNSRFPKIDCESWRTHYNLLSHCKSGLTKEKLRI